MSDTHTAEAESAPAEAPATESEAPATTKKKKRKRVDFGWLKADGEVTKDIAEAAAFTHKTLSTDAMHIMPFNEVDQDIARMLMAHGLKQKSGDCASGARANDNDEDEAVAELFADFKEGNWRGDRGESVAGVKALAEALAFLKGSTDIEAYVAWVSEQSEDQRKDLRKHASVAARIAQVRAERLAAKAKEATEALPDIDLGDTADVA